MSRSFLSFKSPDQHSQSQLPDFGKLGLRDYRDHVQRILDQKLISSVQDPFNFYVSGGCIVASLEQAAGVVLSLIKHPGGMQKPTPLLTEIIEALRSSGNGQPLPFNTLSITAGALTQYYDSCTIRPWGNGYIKITLGDGVIPHSLHHKLSVPLLILAERRDFLLNPIPETKGAKAFSVLAAKDHVQQFLNQYAHTEGYGAEKFLVVCHNDFSVQVGFALESYNPYAVQSEDKLSVYPCLGCQLPLAVSEKLVVTMTPMLPVPSRQLEEVNSYNQKLSETARLITGAVTSLFGVKSPNRIRALT